MTLTDDQRLLLRAALLRGDASLEAWNAWRTRTSVDTLDGDSQWLLPQLYANLHQQGVADDHLRRYRNVLLHNWYKNNLALRRLERLMTSLQHAGCRPVLLGGAAMAIRHYPALGARPFTIPRLLVRSMPSWRSDFGPASAAVVTPRLFDDTLDAEIVSRAETGEWRMNQWLVLSPTDQLADLCVHRDSRDDPSRLLWIADVARLLRGVPGRMRGDRASWAAAAALASRVGQADAVRDAEALLRDLLDGVAEEQPAPGVPAFA